jgi:hypothetical protein
VFKEAVTVPHRQRKVYPSVIVATDNAENINLARKNLEREKKNGPERILSLQKQSSRRRTMPSLTTLI